MKSATALVGVLAVALIAGCGSSGGGTTTVIEQQAAAPTRTVTVQTNSAPAPTVTVEHTNAESTSGSSSSAASSGHAVPRLTGERLDVAEDKLTQTGLRYKEIGGGTFGIVVKSNWTVCQTEPAAGSRTSGRVRLIVDRDC
jgi:myo-inositol-hexaphosphate 3-phosphohydrolase